MICSGVAPTGMPRTTCGSKLLARHCSSVRSSCRRRQSDPSVVIVQGKLGLLQRGQILLHRRIRRWVVFAGADVFGEDLFFDVGFDAFVFFDPLDGFFGEP